MLLLPMLLGYGPKFKVAVMSLLLSNFSLRYKSWGDLAEWQTYEIAAVNLGPGASKKNKTTRNSFGVFFVYMLHELVNIVALFKQ